MFSHALKTRMGRLNGREIRRDDHPPLRHVGPGLLRFGDRQIDHRPCGRHKDKRGEAPVERRKKTDFFDTGEKLLGAAAGAR